LRYRWAVVHGLELFGLEPKVSVQSRGHDGKRSEGTCRKVQPPLSTSVLSSFFFLTSQVFIFHTCILYFKHCSHFLLPSNPEFSVPFPQSDFVFFCPLRLVFPTSVFYLVFSSLSSALFFPLLSSVLFFPSLSSALVFHFLSSVLFFLALS
jgi:hypothetical protein